MLVNHTRARRRSGTSARHRATARTGVLPATGGEAEAWPGPPTKSPRAGRTLNTFAWRICTRRLVAAREPLDGADASGILPDRRPTEGTRRSHHCQGKGEAVYAGLRHRVWAPPGRDLRVRAGPGSAAALAGPRDGPRDGDALWPRRHGGSPPGLWAAPDLRRALGGGGAPACLAAASPAQAVPRGPAPAQALVTAGRQGGAQAAAPPATGC